MPNNELSSGTSPDKMLIESWGAIMFLNLRVDVLGIEVDDALEIAEQTEI